MGDSYRSTPDKKTSKLISVVDELYKLAISLANNLNVDELYQRIVNIGCELTGTTHGFIYVLNKEPEALELKFGTGIYAYYQGILRYKQDRSVSSTVWNTGQLVVVDNLPQWEGRAQDRPYGGDIVKSVVGIPLHSGYEVVAVIGLGFETEELELADETIDLLSRFATLAALAFNNARLYSSLNAELLARGEVNKAQQTILEQQISLYGKELAIAKGAEEQSENPVTQSSDHYVLARWMRRTTQLHLADIYMGSNRSESQSQKQAGPFESITSREQAVLMLMNAGLSNQEIALTMGVSVNTVKTHANHLFSKLGVSRRVQALVMARKLGLL